MDAAHRKRGSGCLNNLIFTSLVSPVIALTLAVPFVALWFNRRERSYLLAIATAYGGASLGFLLQAFTLPIGVLETKLLSNIAFVLSALVLAGAIITRYGRPVPWLPLGLVALGGLAAFYWYLFLQPTLAWRVLATNLTLAAISLMAAAELRRLPDRGLIEKALLALALLSGLNFIIRPIGLVAFYGPPLSYENLYTSLYWTTSLFSHAVFSLLIALSLLAAEALDVIRTLRSESLTDPLSGLLNRRGFDVRAAAMLGVHRSSNLPVSLIVADLDRFKALNDRHGHAAGDRVIAEFGAQLQKAAGPGALAARLGGEEFAVLLPMAGPATARLFAEGVRAQFSASPIEGLPDEVRVSGSFGVASRIADETLYELARRADEALYHAKRDGRDIVRVFSSRRVAGSTLPSSPSLGEEPMPDCLLKFR